MTRRDYILIAEALKVTLRDAVYSEEHDGIKWTGKALVLYVAGNIGTFLDEANPRFDRAHFLAVVRGEKALESRPERYVRRTRKLFGYKAS